MMGRKFWCEEKHPTIRSRWMNDGGYMAEASSTFPLSYQQKHDDKEVKSTSYLGNLQMNVLTLEWHIFLFPTS